MAVLRFGISGLGMGCASPFTIDQIYSFALYAGFPPDVAQQMTAIALRESGGCPDAHNTSCTNPPHCDDSYGLWQINLYDYPPGYKARLMAQLGLTDPQQLFDPGVNASAAYTLWGGNPQNLDTAWYIGRPGPNRDKYLSYLTQVQAALGVNSNPDVILAQNTDPGTPIDTTATWENPTPDTTQASIGGGIGLPIIATAFVALLLLSRD